MAEKASSPVREDPEYGPVFAVLVPQANTTVEPEMQLLLPGTVLAARCTSISPESRQRLIDYFDNLASTLSHFDTAPVRAAGFACTGSCYMVGRAIEDQRLAELSACCGFPLISATQAIRLCLDTLGAKRIALLAPYPQWLSAAAQSYWSAAGYTVTATAGLSSDLVDTRGIYELKSERVSSALKTLHSGNCDVVLLSGTGMPTLSVLAASLQTSPLLISSNLCLAWAMQLAANPRLSGRQALLDFLGSNARWRERLSSRAGQDVVAS